MQYNSISINYQIKFWYGRKDWNETMGENVVWSLKNNKKGEKEGVEKGDWNAEMKNNQWEGSSDNLD